PYTVLTGSMRPDLPPGTLVVVRPVQIDDLAVGDVITYQLRSGRPTVVTHRVVASGFRADGTTVLTTQGDANGVPDVRPVRAEQVRGRLWYAVPHLGRVNTALDGAQRQTAVYVVAAALLLYAASMFVGAVTASRKSRTTEHDETKGEVAR
ncbi:MAG: signal peptidase I, partial [Microbacterium sp.]